MRMSEDQPRRFAAAAMRQQNEMCLCGHEYRFHLKTIKTATEIYGYGKPETKTVMNCGECRCRDFIARNSLRGQQILAKRKSNDKR